MPTGRTHQTNKDKDHMKKQNLTAKRLLSFVLAALLLLSCCTASAQAPADASETDAITYVGQASVALKVRIEPDKNARGVDSIPKNATIYVLELVGDEWAKVQTEHTTGYVMVKYISGMRDVSRVDPSQLMEQQELPDGADPFVAEVSDFEEKYVTYTLYAGYLYTQPSETSGKVGHVPANKEIKVSVVSGDWCYARYKDMEGYMLNSALYKWDRLDPYAGEIPGLQIMPKVVFLNRTAEVYSLEDNTILKDYPMPPGSAITVFEKDALGRYQTPYHRTMGYINEDAVAYEIDVVPWQDAQPGDLISAMTTYYAVGVSTLQYQGRNWNIYMASSMISGTVLQPGQEYDMNKTIGPYRKSTGYHEAPIMSKNASSGYGGGTCQVNTTFYMTNIQVPILVTHRRVHADVGIYYVPRGFDAAVGGGAINLQLTNTLPYAIRYQFFISDGVLTCCIFRA
jgi:SH3-like domain-containing protein